MNFRNLKLKYILLITVGLVVFLAILNYPITKNNNQINSNSKNNLWKQTTSNAISPVKIFCFILSQPSNTNAKEKASSIVWIKDCDGYYIVDKIDPKVDGLRKESFEPLEEAGLNLTDTIKIEVKNAYTKTTDNIFNGFLNIYNNEEKKYDWYLKADDDTFIFMDNLRLFLADKNPNALHTYGYQMNKKEPQKVYLSGGAGYVLSKEALLKLGENLSKNQKYCANNANEDYDVAECLRTLNVSSQPSLSSNGKERFHPMSLNVTLGFDKLHTWWHYHPINSIKTGRECCDEYTISFHYVSKDMMFKLDKTYRNWKKQIAEAADEDELLLYGNFISMLYQAIFQ